MRYAFLLDIFTLPLTVGAGNLPRNVAMLQRKTGTNKTASVSVNKDLNSAGF